MVFLIFIFNYCDISIVNLYQISEKTINYKEKDYIEGLQSIMRNKTQEEIEELAQKNLERLNKLCEVKKR